MRRVQVWGVGGVWGWALAGVLGFALHSAAQEAPPSPPPAPTPPTPASVWASVRGAYGAVPTGERVTVTVAGPDSASKSAESFELRIDPRPGNAAGPRVRLDLGQIRLVAGDGRIVAVHSLSREGAFVAEGLGPLSTASLRSMIPPLPLPSVAALTDIGTPTPSDAAGYIRPIEWTEIASEPGSSNRVIVGRSAGATARLSVASSGRLHSLALTDLPGGGSITVTFTELPAAPTAAEFDLGADGWKRVGSIRELFALPQTPVEPGQEVPELAVQTARGDPLVLQKALAKVAPARVTRADASVDVELDPPAAERFVLVIHRLPVDPAACDAPAPALGAARGALADVLFRSQRDRFLSRAVAGGGDPQRPRLPPISGAVVLVADLGEGNAPDRLERGEKMLASTILPAAHAEHAPRVFEAASVAGVIGPFAANTVPGDTLVVTISRDWKLIRVEPWPAGMTASQGAAQIEKRLRGE